jgi:uncharacterized membrane protein YphA (DoxX/SURF4 family)
MRLIAAAALITRAVSDWHPMNSVAMAVPILAIAVGIMLMAGLWTPIAGGAIAAFELCTAFLQPGDMWTKVLLGTLGIGLALVGPGVWSVDARLFGWKRIDIQHRRS